MKPGQNSTGESVTFEVLPRCLSRCSCDVGAYGSPIPEVIIAKESVFLGLFDSDVDGSCSFFIDVLQDIPHVDRLVGR